PAAMSLAIMASRRPHAASTNAAPSIASSLKPGIENAPFRWLRSPSRPKLTHGGRGGTYKIKGESSFAEPQLSLRQQPPRRITSVRLARRLHDAKDFKCLNSDATPSSDAG